MPGNMDFNFVCVCACVRARVRACVRACVHACVRACVCGLYIFHSLCYSHTVANILANVKKIIFAARGEYMANGLTNAIRHQFAMIAK